MSEPMRIGELPETVGVPTATIRYYEGLVSVDGTARIVKYDGGTLTTLATGRVVFAPERSTRLRMDCLGAPDDTALSLFAGDRLLANVTDHDGHPDGSAGLVLASGDAPNAEASFDDFVILARAGPGR